jgi:mono/diheme cytochrome c family protein
MKFKVVLSAVTLLIVSIASWAADDGAALYKKKCAGCHGTQGEGKMGPKLAGTSMSEDDIVKVLTTGGLAKAPHAKPFKHANSSNAKQVATYVKSLK